MKIAEYNNFDIVTQTIAEGEAINTAYLILEDVDPIPADYTDVTLDIVKIKFCIDWSFLSYLDGVGLIGASSTLQGFGNLTPEEQAIVAETLATDDATIIAYYESLGMTNAEAIAQLESNREEVQESRNEGTNNSDILITFTENTSVGLQVIPGNPFGTYTSAVAFEFRGTSKLGFPKSISIVLDADSASPTHSIRLYDVTNAQVVAFTPNRAIAGQSILELDVFENNLPIEPAVFELQAAKDGMGALTILFGSLSLNY